MTDTDLINKLPADVVEFLGQSNAIEGVYDAQSLIDACKAWDYLMTQEVLTVPVVLTTHRILMEHQNLHRSEIGAFRKQGVYIGGREAVPWTAISFMVGEWLQRMNFDFLRDKKLAIKDKETWTKSLHVHYEYIHPFIDGNGRTGRIFMNWLRVKAFKMPVLVIKESEKFSYYLWFEE